MFLHEVRLERFRNHTLLRAASLAPTTVFVGPNGSGKTNVLEAIDLVVSGRSFRQARLEDIVQWGEEDALVALRGERDGMQLFVEERFRVDGERRLFLEGEEHRRRRDVLRGAYTVTFRPDDLDLVKGPSEIRRDAIDALGSRLSEAYAHARREYARVVRHRNALLREWRAPVDDVEVWTEHAITLGARVLVHRRRLAARLIAHAAERHEALAAAGRLTVEYHDRCGLGITDAGIDVSVEDAQEALRAAFAARRTEERERATTVVGPHRDDLVILLDGREARRFASQGQQRTIALAWRIGEMKTIEDVAGAKPILLLDDVMSELDSERRSGLCQCIAEAAQAFMTTTDRSSVVEQSAGQTALFGLGA